MGRTVPSFRMALESEIKQWRSFRNALTSESDRQSFDELMNMCRNNAMASGAACNPIIFEPMIMSIFLAQQKKIQKLEHAIVALCGNKKSDNTTRSQS